MHCNSIQTDIDTVFGWMRKGSLDLQPDFQRSEVWARRKKQKLIDSILRGWHIPPVHVVVLEDYRQEVLDGQQRLATIRDFVDDRLPIDGKIEPLDPVIERLHGLTYSNMSDDLRRKFDQYELTVVKVTECTPEESGELFFRLNQPIPLTSAEQRNAFMGVPRNQVKKLSADFVEAGACREAIGFSNSRLAYDEIISKFCYAIEIGTLRRKITSSDISDQYRKNKPFSDECVRQAHESLMRFIEGVKCADLTKPSFNKATVYSWLVHIKRCSSEGTGVNELGALINAFERCRIALKPTSIEPGLPGLEDEGLGEYRAKIPYIEPMFAIYAQRSSMASTDVSSVLYRDIVISLFEELHRGRDATNSRLLACAAELFEQTRSIADVLTSIQVLNNWGDRF